MSQVAKLRRLENGVSWGGWKAQWHAVRDLDAAAGLIHCIFRPPVTKDWVHERLELCTEIADGHVMARHQNPLGVLDKPRYDLKRKAFQVLMLHLNSQVNPFQSKNPGETIALLLRFFRPDENGNVIHNIQHGYDNKDHATELAKQFVIRLCMNIWTQNFAPLFHPHDGASADYRTKLNSLRPDVIRTLSACEWDRFALLRLLPISTHRAREGWALFDDQCVEALEKLVSVHPGHSNTIANGVAIGSVPAYVLALRSAAMSA